MSLLVAVVAVCHRLLWALSREVTLLLTDEAERCALRCGTIAREVAHLIAVKALVVAEIIK